MYIYWLVLVCLNVVFVLATFILAPVISLFTSDNRWPSIGGIFYTYDNPPFGDDGYIEKRSHFPLAIDGLEGYINRVGWLFRNPAYGFAKSAGIDYRDVEKMFEHGNLDVSDKYKVSGYYFTSAYDVFGEIIAFEFYGVFPWSSSRCLRVRVGWKLQTDKFERLGFAPFVCMINPFKKYGV